MLRDITVENYRLFEKFYLDGMTQINLLVGENNSGKSSLLEAIYLLINNDNPGALFDILDKRFALRSRIRNRSEMSELSGAFLLSNIFRGHKLQKDHNIIIAAKKDEQTSLECIFVDYGMPWPKRNSKEAGLGLRYRGKKKIDYFFELEQQILSPWYRDRDRIERARTNKHFVTTEHLDQQVVTKLWNQIVLTPKENMVLESLRILEPDIERIALLSQTTPEMSVQLKIKDSDTPVPLGSMGDGMYRIFALAISLVNCENGTLLVDEIDTGLHYEALTKMWRLVIETAKKLNVQVFATTHSWDCLYSFHKALSEGRESDLGTVFRLERKDDQIDYVAYTGEELAIAVEQDIEVR